MSNLRSQLLFVWSSWCESLTIIAPKGVALFVKLSLNCAIRTYEALGFRTLILLVVWAWGVYFFSLRYNHFNELKLWQQISIFYYIPWLLYIMIAVARPSIQRKDSSYFYAGRFRWYSYCWLVLVILLASYYFQKTSFYTENNIAARFLFDDLWWLSSLKIWLLLCMPLVSLFMLFWLDVRASFREFFLSIYRAITMVWLNLPLYGVLYGVQASLFFLSFFVLKKLIEKMSFDNGHLINTLLVTLFPLFLVPFLLAPIVIAYIKKVNEQHRLYF